MKLFLILSLILCYTSCIHDTIDNIEYDNKEILTFNCIEDFGTCEELVNDMDMDNTLAVFIRAKWNSRNLGYLKADSLLSSIVRDMTLLTLDNKIYQDYVITRIENQLKADLYDPEYLESVLNRLEMTSMVETRFYIQLLRLKSNLYRELGEINRSFTIGLYALYLGQSVSLSDFDMASIFTTLSINQLREFISLGYRNTFFIDRAVHYCYQLDHPYCRKIKGIQLVYKHDLKIEDVDINYLIESDQFAPEIDRFNRTNLAYLLHDDSMKVRFLKENIRSIKNSNCSNSFIDYNYLIDHYISKTQLDSAWHYIEVMGSVCIDESFIKTFLHKRSKYRFYIEKFRLTKNIVDLENALRYANSTMNLSSIVLNNENLHFADYMQENVSDLMEIYYLFQEHNMFANHKDDLLALLQKEKARRINMANITDIWANTQLSDKAFKEFNRLRARIDHLELQTHEYKDTILNNLYIYEELYSLYESLAELKKNHPFSSIDLEIKEKTNTLEELQVLLKSNDGQLLEFTSSYMHYYLTYTSPDTFYIDKLEKNTIDKLVKDLVFQIKLKNEFDTLQKISSLLYNRLVEPYIDSKFKHVHIIPDQKLSELPFELLRMNSADSSPVYLLDSFIISYHHSSFISKKSKTSQKTNKGINLFGYSDQSTINDRNKKIFPELPIGKKEIDQISKLYTNPNILEGKLLTRRELLSNLAAPILHFSTHSFSNPANMLENYLLIRDYTGFPEKLYGFDIKNRDLSGSNVILSSCNSGSGAYKFGAGTFSLSRDFLQAGASTVTKSLWAVNESSTAELMVSYHEDLFNYGFSTALTVAKRKLKRNAKYSHPYYWAGFVVEGNTYEN